MLRAESGDASIVDAGSGHCSARDERAQLVPVLVRFRKQYECRRFQPCIDLPKRCLEWRRRIVDARVGNDGEKLVQAWPRDRPSCAAFGKVGDAFCRSGVKRRVLAMRVNEDVGIDCDQEPRPS